MSDQQQQDPYVAEREAAQMRKIQLSMARKVSRGVVVTSDERDRALMDPTAAVAERGFDPRTW